MQYGVFGLLVILTSSIFIFIPDTIIAETEWKIYELSHRGELFRIPYKITNSDIEKIERDPEFETMRVFLKSDPPTGGTIAITIPRELVDPKRQTDQGWDEKQFSVLVDVKLTNYEETVNTPCFHTILIPIVAGSKTIEIIHMLDLQATGTPPPPPQVFVATGKNYYDIGESIAVQGCTSLSLDDQMVSIEVMNPQGMVWRDFTLPTIDGSFSTSLIVQGEDAINGTYTAKATYAGKTATSSFVVPEFPVLTMVIFAIAISFILATRLKPRQLLFSKLLEM